MLSTNYLSVNLPIYGNHTDIVYFSAHKTCKDGTYTLVTNELKPLHNTGSVVPVPYLLGHDYVLLPGSEKGRINIRYHDVVPNYLQNFAFITELQKPEVIDTFKKN